MCKDMQSTHFFHTWTQHKSSMCTHLEVNTQTLFDWLQLSVSGVRACRPLRCMAVGGEVRSSTESHGDGSGQNEAFMESSGLKWWNKNASFNWAPQKMKPYGFPPLLSNSALKNAWVQTAQQYLRSLWRGTPWFLSWKAPIIQTPGVSLWWPNPVRVEKWDI